jgi:EpsI family protein
MNALKGLLSLGAMLVISGATYLLTPVSLTSRDPSFLQHTIPHQFARWRQEADRFVQVDVRVPTPDGGTDDPRRAYDEVLMRTYRRDDGAVVMLALAYGRLQRQEIKIHRPDLCYYGQGFYVRQLTGTRMALTSDVHVNVQKMLARKPRRIELVSYWIRIGDEIPRNAWQTRWFIFKDGIRGVIPDGMLVRVSSLITADDQQDAASEAQQDFLASLYQSLPAADRRLIAGRDVAL